MPWTERQHALLGEMGLRVWGPPLPAALSEAGGSSTWPAAPAAPAVRPAPPLPSPAQPPAAQRPPAAGAEAAERALPLPAAAAQAGPAAVATLDWPALQAAVAGCRACGLCESRTRTVFGTGDPAAHWMVVGEAPGENEDLQGEPFVGAAGQLLDRMLAALQLTRAVDGPQPAARRVFITNTLKCRPPRNRNPSADEMARCEPFLLRQIDLLRPRLILALGRYAAQMLLKSDEPVGRLRGQVHRCQGVPVIVSYHPSYLLRSPSEKARAWEDLCLAAQVAQSAHSAQSGEGAR